MDAALLVVVNRKHDIEEAVRVMTPGVMRQPNVIVYRGICALLAALLAAFGVAVLMPPIQDYVLGTGFIVIAVALFIVPTFAIRRAVKRRIVEDVKRSSGVQTSMTFSDAGVELQGAHSRAHFDWAGIAEGRKIPEGILFRIGRVSTYVATREFDSDDDFERVLALFRTNLGAKFAG